MVLKRRSKRHAEIVEYFQKEFPFIRIDEEYHIGDRLFIDIFLPDLSVAIEVDGAFHDKEIPFFHKSKLDFEEQKFRDKKKMKLSKEKGVIVFRVKADDKRTVPEIVSNIFLLAPKNINNDNKKNKCKICMVRDTFSEDMICSSCKKHKRDER